MKERELNQLYWLNKEIKEQQKRLLELKTVSLIQSPIITGMPFGSGTNDFVANYGAEIVDLENEIDKNLRRCWYTLKRLEKYINSIEDSEMRQIIRLRHISGLTWDEIGYEMSMDRRTVSRKYYKFIKVAHNAHSIYAII